MGFFTGRVTFLRFQVEGPRQDSFGPEHLGRLAEHAIGRQRTADKDGVEVGWIAGDDILDLGFDLAKNVVNDALHFSLRVDAQKLPGELLRAYTRAEVQALAAGNPSGIASARQKREAKEAARERLEAEAKDGRFLRRKAFPLLWDGLANQLLVGTTSSGAVDHARELFKATFGAGLRPVDAGRRAAERAGRANLPPAAFVPAGAPAEVAWARDPASPTHLGNEFLLWLWFVLETEADTLALADGSEVAVMLVRTLTLECPRGQSGSESIRSDAPTRLPEARRAVQAGKLPRQAGMILARHDRQAELTLQAETFAVSGAKLPAGEEGQERARLEERVTQLRHLLETIDLLYDAFLRRRLGADWPAELARLQRWLQRDERGRLAATA
jgi:hypothetical protein